jgi:D-glycero-D-manno-heptose 1,7-bisphosphate phosphatase
MPRRAIFFDRDGVLNRLVFNPKTGAYESPHRPEELDPTPGLGALLRPLQEAGATLFLVSNQPSFAKGKCSLEDLQAVHASLDAHLKLEGVRFANYFYCYHHPDAVVPEFKGPCECRKPSPFFIMKALREHGLDAATAWMVGDQDTDVACGLAAGVRTLQIQTAESADKRGKTQPHLGSPDLATGLAALLQAPWNPSDKERP